VLGAKKVGVISFVAKDLRDMALAFIKVVLKAAMRKSCQSSFGFGIGIKV
jgi:hypothetical protein